MCSWPQPAFHESERRARNSGEGPIRRLEVQGIENETSVGAEGSAMKVLLIFAIGLLSLANGANDNFKGVATLWGSGLTTYWRAIAWATGFTFLGSLTAISFGSALAAKFTGAKLVDTAIVGHSPFLA